MFKKATLLTFTLLLCISSSVYSNIFDAIKKGDKNKVEQLIKNGADVNKADNEGRTPLWWACRDKNLEIVESLLKNDADVNLADKNGITPLWIACFHNNLEIVESLLKKGADVNQVNKGADVNQVNVKPTTPLLWACSHNNFEMVKSLLDNDADVNKGVKSVATPLLEACSKENLKIVKSLLENGADVNQPDNKGRTPLWWACRKKNLEMVKSLVKYGAKITEVEINEAVKNYLELIQEFEKSENKIEFIIKQVNKEKKISQDTKDLIELALERNTLFYKLLDSIKNDKKTMDIMDKLFKENHNFNIFKNAVTDLIDKGVFLQDAICEQDQDDMYVKKGTRFTVKLPSENLNGTSKKLATLKFLMLK